MSNTAKLIADRIRAEIFDMTPIHDIYWKRFGTKKSNMTFRTVHFSTAIDMSSRLTRFRYEYPLTTDEMFSK